MLFLAYLPAKAQDINDTLKIETKDSNALSVTPKTDSISIASSTEDSSAKEQVKEKKQKLHQVRIGFDIAAIPFNFMHPSRRGYEFQADYNWKDNVSWAAEAGWGTGNVNYPFLEYTTNGAFVRLGVEQNLLSVLNIGDFDNAFAGVRYGMGFGKLGDAVYKVPSLFGGVSEGSAPGQAYFVHWGEIVGGVKVGIWKSLYAGWTVRGKFLFNSGTFKEHSPNYIPGFGKGDKKSSFGFNFYLSYGLQWTH